MIIKSMYEKIYVFMLGAAGYGICELLWRGYTHWTMPVLGGVCLFCIYELEKKYHTLPVYLRCFSYGTVITSFELAFGSVINIALGMRVWDYSEVPYNLLGQICPRFFCIWVLLCIPAIFLCKKLLVLFQKNA